MSFSRSVKSPQRLVRMLSLIVTGTGTAAVSGTCANDVTLTDNGTGDYTLTFDEAFGRAPEVVATAVTDNIVCKIGTVTTADAQILTENLTGTATDAVFHVVVIGSDATDAI